MIRLLAGLLLLWSVPLLALQPGTRLRDYAQDRWGVEDGLPQLSVLSITEDALGYLWVGTQTGLARFDGLRFTVLDRLHAGFDTTFVNHSLLDREGRLWFGSPRGVLNWSLGQLTAVPSEPALLSVNALAQTADGAVWSATDRGLYRIDSGKAVLTDLAGEVCLSLADNGPELLIGGVGQLWRRQAGITRNHALAQPALRVQRVLRYQHAWWLGTQDGVWRYAPETGELSRVLPELTGHGVESMRVDRHGLLWVGTTAALLRRSPDGSIAVAAEHERLEQPWVNALYEDRQGDLWIGTQRESLLRFSDSAVRWLGAGDGLADPLVWSLLPGSQGGLWIGSNSGLQRMDSDGRLGPLLVGAAQLPQASIYNLAMAGTDALWLGTRSGLALYRDGKVETPLALAPLAGEQINALQVEPEQTWIGTQSGLYRWRAGELQALGPAAGSADARIRSILVVGPDQLLLGTEGGVRQWREGRFETLPWAQPLEGHFVSRLKWLQPGLLGLTTLDSGLGLMRDGRLLLLGPEHGLPLRNGWTLDVLADGYLYVASINGVYRLALKQLPNPVAPPAVLRVDAEQVIRGRGRTRSHRLGCCNGGADARSAPFGKQLVYGSTSGLVLLDPGAIPAEPPAPRAVIEELRNGQQVFTRAPAQALASASRDIIIEYTGLSLREPEQIEFRYRLLGYSEDWQEVGTRRSAVFTHLPPGRFGFEVQARHPFGHWHANADSMEFEIAAHWYEWRSLQLAALSVLLLTLVWDWRRRMAAFRRRELQLEQAVAQRTAELAAANARLQAANIALEQESRTDPLTGLSNRRAVFESEIQRQGVVAMLDLDHFKQVNDRHGHSVGDQVLMEFALLLRGEIRPGDVLARWGGEEFVVLLARVGPEQARSWAERVRARIAAHRFRLPDGGSISLSVSIGLAGHDEDWQNGQEQADVALYKAKNAGRNCVVTAA